MAKAKTSKTTAPAPAAPTGRHGLERFEMLEVTRAQIHGAPYNPRVLDDRARRKLTTGIKKVGLLAPIVWNKRTGNVVSGHQRLSILDAESKGDQAYKLTVAVVDLDDKTEREANILMNNVEAMGEMDLDKLSSMLSGEGGVKLDLDGTGYDAADVYKLFGDAPGNMAETTAYDELSQHVRNAQEQYSKITKRSDSRDREDFYCVVVFKDHVDRESFCKAFGLANNRYQDGRELRRILEEAGATVQNDEASESSETDA